MLKRTIPCDIAVALILASPENVSPLNMLRAPIESWLAHE